MKLASLRIEKFRGVKDSRLIFDEICCLVGENNTGKSTIFRALNSFFNFDQEERYFKTGQHLYSKQSSPKISLVFNSNNPPKDMASLFEANNLIVTFTYNRSKSIARYRYKKKSAHHDFTADDLRKLKNLKTMKQKIL
jgi:predicted ATP-dependent endonuclease of OLD family